MRPAQPHFLVQVFPSAKDSSIPFADLCLHRCFKGGGMETKGSRQLLLPSIVVRLVTEESDLKRLSVAFRWKDATGQKPVKTNGLEDVVWVMSSLISQIIAMGSVLSQNMLHAFHSTPISVAANQNTDQKKKKESPKKTDRCLKCKNKIDFGEEYICCTDCSDPYLTDKNTKLGYCKTGAELSMQLKPKEIFEWVAGPWMKCSSPCDGGIRYRDVSCFGSIEGESMMPYPVDDDRCSLEDMPTNQEACNLRSCEEFSYDNPKAGKHGTNS
ncbi:hypothetical protein ACLOJK_031935 [Asimina triloba]